MKNSIQKMKMKMKKKNQLMFQPWKQLKLINNEEVNKNCQ